MKPNGIRINKAEQGRALHANEKDQHDILQL